VKFYFDGNCFTYGGGLKRIGVVPEDVRWSRLVCDHFGAEEINLSSGGAPNDRIMRHLLDKPPEVYDFYFLQLGYSHRYEFYDTELKKWIKCSLSETGLRGRKKHDILSEKCVKRWGLEEGSKIAEWIYFGFERIYNDHYAKSQENIIYNALKSYVASIGREKKSFFSTKLPPQSTDNKYDLHLTYTWDTSIKCPKASTIEFDRIPNDGHPSVEGHKTIAKYVIDIVSERLSCTQ
tara:strand:+ start:277 stop:981 length:705 start_codon:yes stop_codon:yes gene_type:complete